jgi:ribosomal protein S6--L-glutamate ligase
MQRSEQPRRVCLIADAPGHPVLSAMVDHLREHHAVEVVDMSSADSTGPAPRPLEAASVYLLKSRHPAALELAKELEGTGATVVNTYRATSSCLDRVTAAERLEQAQLPAPRQRFWPSFAQATPGAIAAAGLDFPFVVKSRRSHKGDLVAAVRTVSELEELQERWGSEPVVLQEFLANDGWDVKAWGIGDRIHVGRRRSPLTSESGSSQIPEGTLSACEAIVARARDAFGLQAYGVDLLITSEGPVVVDVNAFPGFRSMPDADLHLVELVDGLLTNPRRR